MGTNFVFFFWKAVGRNTIGQEDIYSNLGFSEVFFVSRVEKKQSFEYFPTFFRIFEELK